jgi:hypothetical protein
MPQIKSPGQGHYFMNEDFIVHGVYCVSNAGGYEIELSADCDSARVRDAFGSDNPEVSDWFEIEHVFCDEEKDFITVIDSKGYNIPLNQVMRVSCLT